MVAEVKKAYPSVTKVGQQGFCWVGAGWRHGLDTEAVALPWRKNASRLHARCDTYPLPPAPQKPFQPLPLPVAGRVASTPACCPAPTRPRWTPPSASTRPPSPPPTSTPSWAPSACSRQTPPWTTPSTQHFTLTSTRCEQRAQAVIRQHAVHVFLRFKMLASAEAARHSACKHVEEHAACPGHTSLHGIFTHNTPMPHRTSPSLLLTAQARYALGPVQPHSPPLCVAWPHHCVPPPTQLTRMQSFAAKRAKGIPAYIVSYKDMPHGAHVHPRRARSPAHGSRHTARW